MRSAPRKKRESGVLKEVWQAHNELVDFVRETAPMPSSGSGVKVTRTSNGTLFAAEAPKKKDQVSLEIKRLKVTAVNDDTLTCVGLDGDDVGQTFTVAKPFRLRRTPFHGRTVGGRTYTYQTATTRTVRLTTITEAQEIIPIFNLNYDEIHVAAADGISGVTGVDWIDLNTDGRAWAKI